MAIQYQKAGMDAGMLSALGAGLTFPSVNTILSTLAVVVPTLYYGVLLWQTDTVQGWVRRKPKQLTRTEVASVTVALDKAGATIEKAQTTIDNAKENEKG